MDGLEQADRAERSSVVHNEQTSTTVPGAEERPRRFGPALLGQIPVELSRLQQEPILTGECMSCIKFQ